MNRSEKIGERFMKMTRSEINAWQPEMLAKTVKQAAKSPYYKKRFEEMGLDPDSIKSNEDISNMITYSDPARA